VWQLPSGDCVITTTDFSMPVVDDLRDFGRIAAPTRAATYMRWATPLLALAILGMPLGKLPLDFALIGNQ
jgi:selenide,water dikinase